MRWRQDRFINQTKTTLRALLFAAVFFRPPMAQAMTGLGVAGAAIFYGLIVLPAIALVLPIVTLWLARRLELRWSLVCSWIVLFAAIVQTSLIIFIFILGSPPDQGSPLLTFLWKSSFYSLFWLIPLSCFTGLALLVGMPPVNTSKHHPCGKLNIRASAPSRSDKPFWGGRAGNKNN